MLVRGDRLFVRAKEVLGILAVEERSGLASEQNSSTLWFFVKVNNVPLLKNSLMNDP